MINTLTFANELQDASIEKEFAPRRVHLDSAGVSRDSQSDRFGFLVALLRDLKKTYHPFEGGVRSVTERGRPRLSVFARVQGWSA